MNADYSCLRDPENGLPLVNLGDSLSATDGAIYPIVKGIPRFVSAENYSGDFGRQWNRFPTTQLDSYTGLRNSEDRLLRCLGGSSVSKKMVLEAGSGAGRFTELLIKYGAIVHSFDYSAAVEANAANNGQDDNLVLVQADIRRIPFIPASYDFVICLGVQQHTPSPEESMESLWRMVKPGGALVIDHYRWKWRNILPPPIGGAGTIYRWLALKLSPGRRFDWVKSMVDFWFPIHWRFRDSLIMQRLLRRLSPVHFYYPHHNLRDQEMYYEWALLDTHDGTTDFYKHHRTPAQIEKYLKYLGAEDIRVSIGGNGVEASCRKPI